MLNLVPSITNGKTFWMPKAASTLASDIDDIFYFIYYTSLAFFVLIILVMLIFMIKYRKTEKNKKTSNLRGHLKLEILWSIVPTLFMIVMFVWGFKVFMDLNVAPRDSLDIRVTASMWIWSFDYPKDGITSPELVIPVGKPVKLTMNSTDVLHSFFVPEFRVKKDILPNRYTMLWFEPTDPGEYILQCTEYCGNGHSRMLATVRVVTENEYERWIDDGGGMGGEGMSLVDFGKTLFVKQGCATCHSVDGTPLVGPTLKGVYGKMEKFADGSSSQVDDNYIRESIVDPNAKLVVGYTPVMPTYAGRLKDKQINAIIDYIKSLGEGN